MDVLNQGASVLNDGLAYLHENALTLLLCVGVLYYLLRNRFLQAGGSNRSSGTKLDTGRNSSVASGNQDERFQDLLRVRERQQEEARKRSLEAAKLRKIKQAQEKERKNETAKPGAGRKSGAATKKKGYTTGRGGGGYNPMQPWSSSSEGGYKYVSFRVSLSEWENRALYKLEGTGGVGYLSRLHDTHGLTLCCIVFQNIVLYISSRPQRRARPGGGG